MPSRVADITSSLRSSRNPCWLSMAKASAVSACRLRSWNSSKMTSDTPVSSGSCCSIRVSTPRSRSRAGSGCWCGSPRAPAGRCARPPSPQLTREEARDVARREASGLQHDDAPGQPVLAHQLQGQQGRFASAGAPAGSRWYGCRGLQRVRATPGRWGGDKAMGTFCDTSEKGPFCHSLPAIVSAPAGQGQEASGATRQDIRSGCHRMALIRCPSRGPTRRMPKLFFALPLPELAPSLRPGETSAPGPASRCREQPAPDPGLSRGGRRNDPGSPDRGRRATALPPFSVHLDQTGWFQRAKAAWVGPGEWPNELTVLARALRRHGENSGWATASRAIAPTSPCRARRARPRRAACAGFSAQGRSLLPLSIRQHAGRRPLRTARLLAPARPRQNPHREELTP